MGTALARIRQHPAFLGLIVAVVVGQVLQKLLQTSVEEPYGPAEFPVWPVVALVLALALGFVIVVLRVQFGNELVRAAAFSWPAPGSLPARYTVADPPRQLVSGGLALLDLALVLLVQNTLRAPVLVLAERYVPREWANVGFVALVLLAVLLVLLKLYRAGGPVLVLLLWWGLDRVVPTAGFLAAAPPVAVARPRTLVAAPPAALEPTAVTPARNEHEADAPTVLTGRAAQSDGQPSATPARAEQELDPTLVAPARSAAELDPTLVAGALSDQRPADDNATVVAPEKP